MEGRQSEDKSWMLSHIMDRFIGSREMVALRRRLTLMNGYFRKDPKDFSNMFWTGSTAEGFEMQGSDTDIMIIRTGVEVMYPEQYVNTSPGRSGTVFLMKPTPIHASRPGYVALELAHLGQMCSPSITRAIVPIDNVEFISSEILRQQCAHTMESTGVTTIQHGPCATITAEHSDGIDYAPSFHCNSWPREANEWVNRIRRHGWPSQALIHNIIQSGCHLVPVGDRSSSDTFLQWRISFATAERKLVYSLSHQQFLVYGLLKYILKQISERLEQIAMDTKILSSYIMKTLIFFAVENTPSTFWQEKNLFACFWFCLKLLIGWVKSGYCPNYVIIGNNMFLGKVHGEIQKSLLHLLIEIHDMKWNCLSVGTYFQPSLGVNLQLVMDGAWKGLFVSPEKLESDYDHSIYVRTFLIDNSCHEVPNKGMKLLSESHADVEEFLAYYHTVRILSNLGMETYGEYSSTRGNKQKYNVLRKCKRLLIPFASLCTSPGLLNLATFYYQTGNYIEALKCCSEMIKSFKIYIGESMNSIDWDVTYMYQRRYCGKGYTLLDKCKMALVSDISFNVNFMKFCPSQLHPEIRRHHEECPMRIPPLPYAVFLSFLCYHEMGDVKKRDAALIHLRAVKYDQEQGQHWIVYTLLGICYQTVGDNRRAIREYRSSVDVGKWKMYNTALERIAHLEHSA